MTQEQAVRILRLLGFEIRNETYNHETRTWWKVVPDGSVTGGFEVVSPILRGTEGLEALKTLIIGLDDAGGRIDRRCGLHVHFDGGDLGLEDLRSLISRYARYEDEIDAFMPPSRRGDGALFPGDVAYVWHGALHAATVAESLVACGFDIRSQIIWAKERLVLSRGHYHWMHEPCWYAVKGKAHWSGDRKQVTIWNIPSKGQDADTIHGTQKPVECMKRPMENNSSPGQAVYEPFSGSGTSIIAAEITGRACLAMELNPAYVDVAVKRWEDFTGEKAVLEDVR